MKVFVITGQTATGKTDLAVNKALEYDGEIVNADSRHVYRYLDVVTGKDSTRAFQKNIPVHLQDCVTPDQPFSSYDFVLLAIMKIADILKRGKTPIVVGGTYLYIQHLLYGQSIQVQPNPQLREELSQKSKEELQNMLNCLHSNHRLNSSDWNNPRRLIRQIEIYSSVESRKPTRSVPPTHGISTMYDLNIIGLKHPNPDVARKKIQSRVEQRLKDGALDETRSLLKNGYKKTDPGLQTIGYTQLIAHLNGELSLEEAIMRWTTAEVQYAKRQLTFMKKDPYIQWTTVD